MGIEESKKIYVLSHIHTFTDKSACLHHHKAYKKIGVFSSKKKALKVIEDYKNLEGFKKHPEGFVLQEYLINKIDNSSLNKLLEN